MKRMIAWVLVLSLVLSVMPVGVLAEGTQTPPALHSHSGQQHDCEHCDTTVVWEAWGDTEAEKEALPTDGKHYYLVSDVTVTARTTIKNTVDQVLCLNGHTINGSDKDLVYYLQDSAKLTLSDCTAYTDDADVFHAGQITNCAATGSFPSAIYVKGTAQLSVYNCIIANNTHTSNENTAVGYGGAIQVRSESNKTPVVYLEKVWFEGNTCGQDGGAINVRGSAGQLTANNCTFKNNSALNGGAVYATGGTVDLLHCTFAFNDATNGGAVYVNGGNVTVDDCTFTQNTADAGSAVYVTTEVTLMNCRIEKNVSSANSGGTVRLNKAKALLQDCTITENEAAGSGGSALHLGGGDCDVTIQNTTITGNRNTSKNSDYRGAVYVTNASDKLTLVGKVVIDGNYKLDADGNQVATSIYQQNSPNAVDVGGLTEGSKVNIHTRNKTATTPTMVTAKTAPTTWKRTWVVYDNNGMAVEYDATNGFYFALNTDHVHCECGAESCTNTSHKKVEYQRWDKAGEMPGSGNYYLDYANKELQLTGETSVTADLNLCLNGHTVTAASEKRHISTPKDTVAVINLTDCTATTVDGVYTAGKLTGGLDITTNQGGGSIYIRAKGTLNLYEGIIGGNRSYMAGGALMFATGAAFNMYGGEISNNKALAADNKTRRSGGAMYCAPSSAISLLGGTIKDNEGNIGGGVYYHNSGNLVIGEDLVITGNTAYNQGGGIYTTAATVNISGATVSANHSVSYGGGAYFGEGAQVTVTGGEFSGNTTDNGGAGIYTNKSNAFTISNAVIKDNVAKNNAGGLFLDEADATLTNVTFSRNKGTKDGGGIYVRNGKLDITGGSFTNNENEAAGGAIAYGSNSSGKITGTLFDNNRAGAGGALIIQNGANVEIADATIKSNSSEGRGGAIYLYKANLKLSGGTITGNASTEYAGAIDVRETGSLTVSGTAITDNQPSGQGAVQVSANSSITLEGKTQIKNNGAVNLKLLSGATMFVGTMEAGASVAVTAEAGPISQPCTDMSAFFTSDSKYQKVGYKEGALHIVAGGEHKHCLCNANLSGCDHGDIEWMAWEGTASLPSSGNYYLLNDVTLTNRVEVYGELNLCLNGKTITANGVENTGADMHFKVMDQGVLSITDCATEPGKLTGGTYGVVLMNWDTSGGTFNLYNGILTGNEGNASGGAVMVQCSKPEGNTFNMYGGKITGNTEHAFLKNGEITGGNGGGVYVLRSTFNMYGGEISGNKAIKLTEDGKTVGGRGGAVYAELGAKVNLLGGTIQKNHATGDGGGLYVVNPDTVLTLDGTHIDDNVADNAAGGVLVATRAHLEFKSGKITNNKTVNGGGLYISTNTTMNMTGGTVSGNCASKNGGGITLYNSKATISGGLISENVAGGNAGGINVSGTSQLTVSGEPNVTCNTAGDKVNNIYLPAGAVITLGELGKNAKLGVSAAEAFKAISSESQTDYSANFISDLTSLQVIYKNKTLYLEASGDHKHCLCIGASKTGCDHGSVTFAAWSDPNKLPAAGNYYLTCDVTLTNRVEVSSGLNLCLNGKTIRANGQENTGADMHFKVMGQGVLSITDCATEPGKLTGGTYGVVLMNWDTSGGTFNLYNGILTGNEGNASGGAVMVQCSKAEGNTFNMYGGKITGNTEHAFLRDGKVVGGNGGGVYVLRSTFNMYGGEISGNEAVKLTENGKTTGGRGGGVYAELASKVNLLGGTIQKNHATGDGGGVYVINPNTVLTLDGTQISGNQADNSAGGILTATRAHLEFKSGSVMNNQAANSGGGLFISTNTTMNMTGGTVSGNRAVKDGGGISLYRCEATLHGGTISDNTAKNGGGIQCSASKLDIKNVTITKNTVTGSGGGIRISRVTVGETSIPSDVAFRDGTIADNTAKVGGGVEMEGVDSKFTMTGGKISGNSAMDSGGGIWVSTKTFFVMEGGIISGNAAEKSGGGVVLYKASGEFIGGEITGNKAVTSAGGVYVNQEGTECVFRGTLISKNSTKNGAGVLIANKATAELKAGKITGNTASASGAGVYVSSNSTFKMTGGSISGNTAKASGGGVNCLRTTVTLSGGSISGNNAKDGGGVNSTGATIYLNGTSVTGNTAANSGGGLKTGNTTVTSKGVKKTYTPKIVLNSSLISGNKAKTGAGILVAGAEGVMQMNGGSVQNNVASGNCGGVYISTKTTFTMKGGVIKNNKSEGSGGGVYHYKSTGVYENAEVSGNTATASGGGLLFSTGATAQFKNVKINDNHGEKGCGGAVYMNNDVVCTFVDSQLCNNTIGTYGGAVYSAPGANPIMTGCELKDNEAKLNGGAICARDTATLTDCVISGNKAVSGAGIHAGDREYTIAVNGWGSKGDEVGLLVTDCLIQDNDASENGGGICMTVSCYSTITGTTFNGNTAGKQGSAIWARDNLTMDSLTVKGNVAANNGYAVYLADSEYDGHSYFNGLMTMGGDMIVTENQGGDMYLGVKTAIALMAKGLDKNTNVNITLDSGLLTQRIYGAYNYEGGDCVYTITYGDRSMTDPEYMAPTEEEGTGAAEDVLLYVGIGVFAVLIAVVVVILLKKKKNIKNTAEAEQK